MLPGYPTIQIPHIYIITVIGEKEHPYQNTYSAPTVNILGGIIMNNNMITTNDKFNRTASTSKNTNVANNKIEVTLDRFPNIKGTEVEKVLREFAAIMAEADRHEKEGDEYFDYAEDRARASARIDMLIKLIYTEGGDIDKIKEDYTYENSRVVSMELSDHYWAF
jgi:hypothetical protein